MTTGAQILIVEDDEDIRSMLYALLRDMGHAVTVAGTSDDALELVLGRADIDVVISDVMMPGMNGIDFAQRARAARPGMPVILVTGNGRAVDDVIASGFVALLKPYTYDALQRILSEALASRAR